MDTVRVNVCYRPMRICWVIAKGDFSAFRRAVRLSYAFWGGRYNPIVIADHPSADEIIELFRADLVWPLGDSPSVGETVKRYSHLISPFFHEDLIYGKHAHEARSQVLDIQNALIYWRDKPDWNQLKTTAGVRLYTWDKDDSLADVLLMQLGGYPDPAEIHIDYLRLVREASGAVDCALASNAAIPGDVFDYSTISHLSRAGLRAHYGIRSAWKHEGFYLGDSGNHEDLINCWNLRAANVPLLFVDAKHLGRYEHILPAWKKMVSESLASRRSDDLNSPAIWARDEITNDHAAHSANVKEIFGLAGAMLCRVGDGLWNGLNLQAPMMILGETSQLGVLSGEGEQPKLSFALGEKPFAGDLWFHSQHLVASVSVLGGLYRDDLHTFDIPFVPELNEFYARATHVSYNQFRIEPERIGLIVDASDPDAYVYALPVNKLFERIFALAGFRAQLSAGGLIARQIITQLDGLEGASVFKIPGVRRLMKTYGPTEPFTIKAAQQQIGQRDPDDPTEASFDEFDLHVHVERADKERMSPKDVFAYLVEKRLFRFGAFLSCSHCRMGSWISLDALRQQVDCELCGRRFDATRQLVHGNSYYRRSGVMGAQKDAQGAIPVILTLHQLSTNLSPTHRGKLYVTSLDLIPEGSCALPPMEVDFAWIVNESYPQRTTIILGECKDRGRKNDGGDGGTIDARDIANLKALADALPKKRFGTLRCARETLRIHRRRNRCRANHQRTVSSALYSSDTSRARALAYL